MGESHVQELDNILENNLKIHCNNSTLVNIMNTKSIFIIIKDIQLISFRKISAIHCGNQMWTTWLSNSIKSLLYYQVYQWL
jgi:hypothetical protein